MNLQKKLLLIASIFILVMIISLPVHCQTNLRLASASTTGVFFAQGTAIEALFREKVPGIRVFNQATGGSGDNCNLLKNKEVEIALAHSTSAIDAYKGTKTFEGNRVDNMRVVSLLWRSVIQPCASKDSGIESLADFRGKRVQIGPIGSGIETYTLQTLSAYDISAEDLNYERYSVAEAVEQLKNRQLDAWIQGSIVPDAPMIDVMTTGRFKLIGLEEDKVQKLVDMYGYFFPSEIPANSYSNQPDVINTVAQATLILVREDISIEVVYEFTKALFENHDELVQMHPAFKDLNLDLAVMGHGGIPMHPGAEKYYKEKGIL